MRIRNVFLLVILAQSCLVLVPAAIPGILVTLMVTVLSSIVKVGVERLMNKGLDLLEKRENDKLKEIARKSREKNPLTDLEKESIIKAVLMNLMIDKIYRVDYNCTLNTYKDELEISFLFGNPKVPTVVYEPW